MNRKHHSKLWLYFTGIVFATIFVICTLTTLLWIALFELNILPISPHDKPLPIILFATGSLLLGIIIAVFVGRLIIRPIQNISNAFDELSKGNFNVRVCENERIIEIKEMAQRFNAMVYDLSHIETLRSDFVTNVSHEFKTPIASIEGYATLLQNNRLTPEKNNYYIKKILENSRRLTNLSGNILMLSKLNNQETIPDQSEYRLDEQIRRCILMLEHKWSPKNIEFDINSPNIYYFGSEPLLDQVWINILDNAIKHSPDYGYIHVTINEHQKTILTSISDEGDGMSEDVKKHIFEKFFQGDASRITEGNGLGLALVKRIIELSKGSITVESSLGAGTTFHVTLPLE